MAKAKLKEVVDEDGYSLSPIDISKTAWMYEEAKGLTVVAEDRSANGMLHSSIQTVIPWDLLCAAVDKHRKLSR